MGEFVKIWYNCAMKALIQRVTSASVNVNHQSIATIQQGVLVLLGVEQGDSIKIAEAMVKKIVSLRIFNNSQGKFDLSLNDVTGDLLMVSQFTLMADCKKGARPSFTAAAAPQTAQPLFDSTVDYTKSITHGAVKTGEFGANMQVSLANDGPVTIWLDSHKLFPQLA
jgi:D-tyrosyl-tRNA(Tyr) deacylase